jgi:hypothetical protein
LTAARLNYFQQKRGFHMRIRQSIFAITVSMVALVSAVSAEAAVDAQKVVDLLAAKMNNFGMTLKTASVELSGTNVIAKGLAMSSAKFRHLPARLNNLMAA